MGGDHLHSFASEDESSTLDNDDVYSEISSYPSSFYRDENESMSESSGHLYRGFDEVGHAVEFDSTLRRRKVSYNEIMSNYDELWSRRESLSQAKNTISSYSPGAWISNAGNKKLLQDYVLPKTTSLIMVGPKGSGKSSLVNRISRVFEHDKFASERAQVTYNNSCNEEGTFFLQEYPIPRSSPSFSLFDTRSLSEDVTDNDSMLQLWMIKGVRHGELVVRDSDSQILKMSLNCKARQSGTPSKEIKKVNFVVFVVNGLSVLRAMNSTHNEEARRYMDLVTTTFNCPYISFKDDKPVIVVTHGDLLSLGDRARVRVYLGEKLGVPPAKQIFDIPDNSDALTELTIVDMIRYALEHADKHMPCRESNEWVDRSKVSLERFKSEVSSSWIVAWMFIALLLGIACVKFPMRGFRNHDSLLPESAKSTMNPPYYYQPHDSRDSHVKFPSYSYSDSKSAINYSQNKEPDVKSPQTQTQTRTLPSKPMVGPQGPESTTLHANQEQQDPKLEDENQTQEVTPNFQSQSQSQSENEGKARFQSQSQSENEVKARFQSQSQSENEELQDWEGQERFQSQSENEELQDWEGKPRLSRSSSSADSHAESSPKSDGGKSRSPSPSSSPKKRHPKSAVKWHKVRHLWLDE